jgi:hypothetical protein
MVFWQTIMLKNFFLFKNRDVITKWVHFAAICKRFKPFGTFATDRHSINQYVVQQVAKSLCKNVLSITQP